jgi:hypothetical protein
MIATRAMIASLRVHGRQRIDRDLETLILTQFGTEPLPNEYSEQDLYEQIRKLIDRHNEGGIPEIPF